jgi:TolB protein
MKQMFRIIAVVILGLLVIGIVQAENKEEPKKDPEGEICEECLSELKELLTNQGKLIIANIQKCPICQKEDTNPILQDKICQKCAVKEMQCARCLISMGLPKHLNDIKGLTSDKILFISDRDGENEIFIMDPSGKNPVQLTQNQNVEMDPSVSPNGKWIAVSVYCDGQWDLYIMDINGKHLRRLTKSKEPEFSAQWFPDNQKLIFTLKANGLEKIYTISRDGTNLSLLELPDDFKQKNICFSSISPDGKKIAFVAGSADNDMTWDIYIREDSKTVKQITKDESFDSCPVFSPDGKKILFVSNRDGNDEIYVMDIDGKNVKRLTENAFTDTAPTWTPDGKKILFASSRDQEKEGIADVYIMDANGKNQVNLTNAPKKDLAPKWIKSGQQKK